MAEEQDIETKAKDMGWSPKEEFRGDPERWIDAETYVRRGEELMPILRANNKRMSEDLGKVRSELAETKALLTASAESIEALKEFNTGQMRKEAKEQVKELKSALVEARESNDIDKEVEIQEQLTAHTVALREAEKSSKEPEKKAEKKEPQVDPTQAPEWKEWVGENKWFGSDKRRTALALGVAEELKANPETANLKGRELLDRVSEEVEKVFGGPRTGPSKVEGGGRGPRSGNGKSFADLPNEAREVCERQAARLVGPSRAFKTVQEWRDHYAQQYFEE